MPKKYSIHTHNADPRFPPVGKYATVEFREDCAGSCQMCVKKRCVYGVFKDNFLSWSNMTGPEYLYICKSCLRCVEECTKGIFSMAINPEYRDLGDDYWTPAIINSTWAQAHTGRIPVSGAGYRGPFAGEGFDSIWTDMSEIVRPTRDGIHGREYINTMVELSRRHGQLQFDGVTLVTETTPILEIPLPVTLLQPKFGVLNETTLLAMAEAAVATGTFLFIQPESYSPAFDRYASNLVPCLTPQNYQRYEKLIEQSRMVEIADTAGIEKVIAEIRATRPELFIAAGITLDVMASERTVALCNAQVDTIHLYGTDNGREQHATSPRYIKDLIREVHLRLIDERARNHVNLLVSGGIAMAEHMAKSLICGADAVAIDIPLLIALECRLCYRCKKGKSCPVKLEQLEVAWGSQRIINLLSAWHSQLLEVMGACGIREARRMRGEVGRSMWFNDLERDSFSPIFGQRKATPV